MTSTNLRLLAMLSGTIFMGSLLSGCDSAESAAVQAETVRPVKLITIGDSDFQKNRIFPAELAANQQADLAFRINGELVKLDLIEGQQVKKGQLLAQLDDRDAKNNLLNAEANYDLAELDFQRKQQLLKQKLISKAEFDSARATLKSTKSALNSAQDQLKYTRLTAPFSGVVAKVESDNYQMIQAAQVVLALQGNQLLDVTIQVPESLIISLDKNKLNKQYQPQIRFVSQGPNDDTYPVRYKERSSKVSPGTQTYAVTFSFAPPKNLYVIPGMSAELLLDMSAIYRSQLSEENRGSIEVLPQSAIVKSDIDGTTNVWRFNTANNRLEAVNVTLGQIRTNGIEVLSGLNKGDQIVAVGAFAVKAGMEVKPLRWERGV
ncbi:efflux RND transporter periplasmic adaptor subunit [Psychromonas ossibalaenae]|uniref:efflux RND transporter periplasmic adaptor subunit n=1 Tax=Psychromonas ossibalaenae TaxID=444922 RepID=UPI00036EB4D1|nr:efflux RND transporter periplasmic adaptor subunit [Psychromonas ossibalaenae]